MNEDRGILDMLARVAAANDRYALTELVVDMVRLKYVVDGYFVSGRLWRVVNARFDALIEEEERGARERKAIPRERDLAIRRREEAAVEREEAEATRIRMLEYENWLKEKEARKARNLKDRLERARYKKRDNPPSHQRAYKYSDYRPNSEILPAPSPNYYHRYVTQPTHTGYTNDDWEAELAEYGYPEQAEDISRPGLFDPVPDYFGGAW